MLAAFLLELGEGFDVVLGAFLAEPVEMGFPVGASLGNPTALPLRRNSKLSPRSTASRMLAVLRFSSRIVSIFMSDSPKPDTHFAQGLFSMLLLRRGA